MSWWINRNGTPLGVTGCILTGTIMDEIERRDMNTGLIIYVLEGEWVSQQL